MYTNLFISAISIILVILWIYASSTKLLDMKKFRYALSVQAFPKWMGRILSWVLPIAELAVTGLLLFDETRLLGMYLSFIMMLAFTLYVGGVIFKVYNVYPCPCGGLFRRMGWKKHFKVNLWLTALALAGILLMEFGKN